MRSTAIIIAGTLITLMSFTVAFVLASALGGIAWLFIEGVEVLNNALTFATYSGILTAVLYIYLIWSGKVVVNPDDGD